jgi:membrane-associated phospholipid phosphatase
MSDRSWSRFTLSALFSLLVFVSSLSAQSLPAVATGDTIAAPTQETPTLKTPETPALNKDEFFSPKAFTHQLMSDQKAIWTSPAHIQKSDAKWLVPLAAGTTVLFLEDTKISNAVVGKTTLANDADKISNIGLYSTWAVPGAFLALGKIKDNDHMVDTGERGLQAAVYSTIVMQAMKLATNRMRPGDGGNGGFLNGGDSFPSGHSMEAWALATVIAREYPDKPLVKWGMYSFATAVSLSRIANQRHYASDVVVGGSIGYLIGRFVTRNMQAHPVEAQ